MVEKSSLVAEVNTVDPYVVTTSFPTSTCIWCIHEARKLNSSFLFSSDLKNWDQFFGIGADGFMKTRQPFPRSSLVRFFRLWGRYWSHTTSNRFAVWSWDCTYGMKTLSAYS